MYIPKGALAPVYRGGRKRSAVRQEAYLLPILHRSRGEWVACPSHAKLAQYLGYAISTISAAFRAMEKDPLCPIEFASDYGGPGRTRRKLMALKTWLDKGPCGHDRQPLHYREDGSARGTRPSFRKGAEGFPLSKREIIEPQTPSSNDTENPDKNSGSNFDSVEPPYIERTTSADKPLPSGGLSGCVPEGMSLLDYYMSLPADYDVSLIPPPPQKPLSPNALAWLHARLAQHDGELFYDNRKPLMPVASLRTLLLPAFEWGMSWERTIRPALLWALRQAHAAACLGQVWNSGGMAAQIFRARLGLSGSIRKKLMRQRTQMDQSKVRKTVSAACLKTPRASAPPPDRAAVCAQFAEMAAALRRGFV